MQRVIAGPYTPDQPSHLQEGLLTADGIYSIANGYAPLQQFAAGAEGTMDNACLGAGAYRAGDDVIILAGDETDIYRYTSAGFGSLKTGLNSSAAVGYRFCPYNSYMLITNGVDPVQKFDPASPSATSDLDASAPTLRFMAVVRGFVVGGYADDDALTLAWSDNGDPATWTPGTGEAGIYIMPTGGDITGVVGGEYGLIFQENRILRMSYTADDAIWQFDEIATDVGCIAPWSLATYGKLTFFLSNKGFMACDGVTVEAIGSEKIDRTFLALVDRSYLERMSAVVDPRNSLYMVMAPSAFPANKMFLYQFALQKWSRATQSVERLFSSLGQGVDLEGLDAIYGNLDTIPISLDSALFRGGYPLVMLFDGTHTLGGFSGPNMAATMQGPLQELFPGSTARITAVRPLTDAATATVTLAGSQTLSDGLTATDYTTRASGGFYRTRKSAALSQVTVSIPAGTAWGYYQGYDIDAVQGGRA